MNVYVLAATVAGVFTAIGALITLSMKHGKATEIRRQDRIAKETMLRARQEIKAANAAMDEVRAKARLTVARKLAHIEKSVGRPLTHKELADFEAQAQQAVIRALGDS